MTKRLWALDLSEAAEHDFESILVWTAETFGPRQAETYAKLIEAAFDKLMRDPGSSPGRSREDDIGAGLYSLHLARPGRHFLLYRIVGERVRIMRILHDSMETTRHLPPGG